jgi:hypothetical protein
VLFEHLRVDDGREDDFDALGSLSSKHDLDRCIVARADGTVGDVDFAGREWRGVFEALGDPSYFARVAVDPEGGTIAWPNGTDMAPEPLYDEARRNVAHATPASG